MRYSIGTSQKMPRRGEKLLKVYGSSLIIADKAAFRFHLIFQLLLSSAANNHSWIIKPWGYEIKPQRQRAHGGRTDGDDYLLRSNYYLLFKCW